MCGRYAEIASADDLQFVFTVETLPLLPPRYNIAPTQAAPVVLITPTGVREIVMLQWGLVPHWAQDATGAARMINARSETVATKPAFRDPFRYRRCIVPCSGFYEWQQTPDGKIPHFITRPDRRVFGLAGLWEAWQSPDGTEAHTFTVLTTTPSADVVALHDRMPVILEPVDYSLWLDPKVQDVEVLQPLLRPTPSGWLEAFPVSTHVNRVSNDDPSCVEPRDPPPEQLSLF